MRLQIVPESLLDRIALTFNLVPTPLGDTQIAFNSARAIMAGSVLGVFEAVGKEPLSADEVAARCALHPGATKQLLHCLTGIHYLHYANGKFTLPRRLAKWLLRDSPTSVADKLEFQLIEWNWMAGLEDFVRTGKPLDFHENMNPHEWSLYQKGMRAMSATIAEQVGKKLDLPAGATRMLDVGGAHGLYSAALLRQYPALTSTILELPGAIDEASRIVAKEGLGDRVRHLAGNVLTDDIGTDWDVVFISNVVHHFNVEQNRALAIKVREALEPGGLYVIGEFIRADEPGGGGAVGATSDLYFALTSASGTWSQPEIAGWMEDAGFHVERTITYVGMPYVSVVGKKQR
jgi:cyclopropane fatty-acyl-phospholipid synthase-like methyltransferase